MGISWGSIIYINDMKTFAFSNFNIGIHFKSVVIFYTVLLLFREITEIFGNFAKLLVVVKCKNSEKKYM